MGQYVTWVCFAKIGFVFGSGALPVTKMGSKWRDLVVPDRAERPLKEWRGGAKLHKR